MGMSKPSILDVKFTTRSPMPNINGAILTNFGVLIKFFASLFLGGTYGHLLIPLLVLPI
jgi:hypothetical protein